MLTLDSDFRHIELEHSNVPVHLSVLFDVLTSAILSVDHRLRRAARNFFLSLISRQRKLLVGCR